jgi:hypothetical protein
VLLGQAGRAATMELEAELLEEGKKLEEELSKVERAEEKEINKLCNHVRTTTIEMVQYTLQPTQQDQPPANGAKEKVQEIQLPLSFDSLSLF